MLGFADPPGPAGKRCALPEPCGGAREGGVTSLRGWPPRKAVPPGSTTAVSEPARAPAGRLLTED